MSAIPVSSRVTVAELRADIERGDLPRRCLRASHIVAHYGCKDATARRLISRAADEGVLRTGERVDVGAPIRARVWRLA